MGDEMAQLRLKQSEPQSMERMHGIVDKQVEIFQSMVEAMPTSAEAHFMLGGALADVAEIRGGDKQTLQEALRAVDRALSIDPYHLDGLLRRAILLSKTGRHGRSAPHCDEPLQSSLMIRM